MFSSTEEKFISTHARDEDGRFLVRLPLRHEVTMLGESKHITLNRFNTLEKKLQRNHNLKCGYVKFMDEYQKLGHMSEVVANNDVFNYLPHHYVVKDTSTTKRVRVVFDASARTDSGMSLNGILMSGPTIQQELFSVLPRFRKHRYALTVDCAKIYRHVNIQSIES